MCLTVKSSIQPTSRPSGTDDDMEGSDKLTTSQETQGTGRGGRRSAQLFFKTGQFDPVLTFYDISGAGMHVPGTPKNRRCGPTAPQPPPQGKATEADHCNPPPAGYHNRTKISFFFR